jgi:hypothetical protein
MNSDSHSPIISQHHLLVTPGVVVMLVITTAASADNKNRYSTGENGVGYTAIAGSPLTINVAMDASYQVIHDMIPLDPGQVYPPAASEADAGLFLWYDGIAMGPDFDNHASGSAANDYAPWKSISQSELLGSGTSTNPWIVETIVANASAGTTMYVDGNVFFRIDWEI